MRELKFRGIRRDNGDFIYGSLSMGGGLPFDKNKTFIEPILPVLRRIEVEPETVGQFTGLHDAKGAGIYEGDLLRVPADEKWKEVNYSAFEVFFHSNDCADNHVGFQMNRMHNYGSIAGGFCGYKFLPKTTAQFEVVGNIHKQEVENVQ